MRYSYCWDLTEWGQEDHVVPDGDWPYYAYASVRGEVLEVHERSEYRDGDEVSVEWGVVDCVVRVPDSSIFTVGSIVSVRWRANGVYLDGTGSRFHGASIAGLVVGAMGCFIFGLYLRRWLRERKALASQPKQDMIA